MKIALLIWLALPCILSDDHQTIVPDNLVKSVKQRRHMGVARDRTVPFLVMTLSASTAFAIIFSKE